MFMYNSVGVTKDVKYQWDEGTLSLKNGLKIGECGAVAAGGGCLAAHNLICWASGGREASSGKTQRQRQRKLKEIGKDKQRDKHGMQYSHSLSQWWGRTLFNWNFDEEIGHWTKKGNCTFQSQNNNCNINVRRIFPCPKYFSLFEKPSHWSQFWGHNNTQRREAKS